MAARLACFRPARTGCEPAVPKEVCDEAGSSLEGSQGGDGAVAIVDLRAAATRRPAPQSDRCCDRRTGKDARLRPARREPVPATGRKSPAAPRSVGRSPASGVFSMKSRIGRFMSLAHVLDGLGYRGAGPPVRDPYRPTGSPVPGRPALSSPRRLPDQDGPEHSVQTDPAAQNRLDTAVEGVGRTQGLRGRVRGGPSPPPAPRRASRRHPSHGRWRAWSTQPAARRRRTRTGRAAASRPSSMPVLAEADRIMSTSPGTASASSRHSRMAAISPRPSRAGRTSFHASLVDAAPAISARGRAFAGDRVVAAFEDQCRRTFRRDRASSRR